jgi:FMN phosphatase YigB (HAD superfamily)
MNRKMLTFDCYGTLLNTSPLYAITPVDQCALFRLQGSLIASHPITYMVQ